MNHEIISNELDERSQVLIEKVEEMEKEIDSKNKEIDSKNKEIRKYLEHLVRKWMLINYAFLMKQKNIVIQK